MNGKISVYRHYDSSGALLYVGLTRTFVGRHLNHSASSKWADRIARITVDLYSDPIEAAEAERRAQCEEAPLYNTPTVLMSDVEALRVGKRPGHAGFGRPPSIGYTLAQADAIIASWHDVPRRPPSDVARETDRLLSLPDGTIQTWWVRDLVKKFVGSAARDAPPEWQGIDVANDSDS